MKILFVFLLFLLSSCTPTLWHQSKPEVEYLNGFYVNKDIHVLLASTDKHGYIFPISNDVEKILHLSRSILFQPNFNIFSVNRYHEVSGNLTLILDYKNIPQKDFEILQQLGFEQNSSQNKKLKFSVFLKGKQYEIDGDLPLIKLDHKYKIIINKPDFFSNTATKIIATQVTIAFDAVVVLPASFVLATFWIIAEQ